MTGASSPSRPEPGEGDNLRRDTLFLTRTSQAYAAVAVAGLFLLVPLYLLGYGFAFYLILAGVSGGLAAAGADLFWNGSILTPAEARRQRRYDLGQELKMVLVVAGAIVGLFGFLFALYVLGAYVVAPILRYFL